MEESFLKKIPQLIGNLSLGRVALIALGLTGAYYATFYDNGENLNRSIEAAKIQLQTENTKKIETQKVLKKEQQMKADFELLAQKFEVIKARIPLDFLESDLRSIVDHYSSQNNLKTTRTDRRQIVTKASTNKNDHENLVEQVALGYEFEGSYNNIAKFVSEISSLEKLIKIGDFELSLRSTRDGSSKKNKDLNFKVNIIGFKQSLEAVKNVQKKESP